MPAAGTSDQGFAWYSAFDYDANVRNIVATMDAARSLLGANGKLALTVCCLGGLTFITTARKTLARNHLDCEAETSRT